MKIKENSGLVNIAINLAILVLLIYTALGIKALKDDILNPHGYMIPLNDRAEVQPLTGEQLEGHLRDQVLRLLGDAVEQLAESQKEQ